MANGKKIVGCGGDTGKRFIKDGLRILDQGRRGIEVILCIQVKVNYVVAKSIHLGFTFYGAL